MMEISLIRHGKSACPHERNISCEKFNSWVKSYDQNGVIKETAYPNETLNKIQSAAIVLTSDLKRSIESAEFLSSGSKAVSLSLFRETELPILSLKIRGLALHSSIWAVALRVAWFCGYSNGSESYIHAKKRAEKAAEQLVKLAHEHDHIALVGHGFFNRFIAKELLKKGWKGDKKTDRKHWACTTYYLNGLSTLP